MVKQVLLTCLLFCLSLCGLPVSRQRVASAAAANDRANTAANDLKDKATAKLEAKTGAKEPALSGLPTALLDELQAWAKRVDFWQLVERGERLAARIEVRAVKSNALEAWVCGQTKICVSTRLLGEFQPSAQQAVIAHELGHLLIARNYAAHPQLWETQCDLFAVAFLRDAGQMKEMLIRLANDCPTCRDSAHPAPTARAALVERYSATALTKVLKFDEFRVRSYAVQYHQYQGKQRNVPSRLQQLDFAIKHAIAAPRSLAQLKTLSFAIGFNEPPQKR